jgi:hypothetical protein
MTHVIKKPEVLVSRCELLGSISKLSFAKALDHAAKETQQKRSDFPPHIPFLE